MTYRKFQAYLDNRLLVDQNVDLTQQDIRAIVNEYHARITNKYPNPRDRSVMWYIFERDRPVRRVQSDEES